MSDSDPAPAQPEPQPESQPATQPGSSGLFQFIATRPVAISMLVAAAVVFGLVGYLRLPVNLLPEISHPTLTIRTEYPGASPQDVEERISERIQEQVGVINGVQRVVSISRPGVSDVLLTFNWGTPMVFAISDVRERLDRYFPPAGAETPLVLRYDPSLDPVLTIGVTGELSQIALRKLCEDELEQELSEIDGVAAVKVRGGEEEEIRIAVDEQQLSLYGLDISVIGRRLAAENINAAAGRIEEAKTEYLVRALNEFRNLEEIREVVLERRGEVSIRLKDVAEVRRVAKDREVISRVDGRPCVLLDVYKEADANIVQLCAEVRRQVLGSAEQQQYVADKKHLEPAPAAPAPGSDEETMGKYRRERAAHGRRRATMTNYLGFKMQREGAELDLLQDQSQFIEQSIRDVRDSAIAGGFFAICVIFLFLRRLRTTGILFVSIPISIAATFGPLFLTGIDINIMSLGGLALGVGMLVDNSIVVLESITRAEEEGADRRTAAVRGVGRVATAVVASTLTTVAVFFPIVFVEGVAGQLFRDQALTVVYALLISLAVALFVIPMLAARKDTELLSLAGGVLLPPLLEASNEDRVDARPEPESQPGPLRRRLTGISRRIGGGLRRAWIFACTPLRLALRPLTRPRSQSPAAERPSRFAAAYMALLRAALRRRALVLLGCLLLLGFAGWRATALGNELLPEVRQGEFYLEAFLRRDATVERTDEVLQKVEAQIRAHPQVARTFLASGVDKQELNSSDEGEHSARVLVTLIPHLDREAQENKVLAAIREMVRRRPEIRAFRFARPSVLAFNAPVVVEAYGRDVFQLRRVCEQIAEGMRRIPGLRDIRSTLQRGNIEISVVYDREKISALGLQTRAITDILQSKVQGEVPTLFAERERKIDMLVRVDRQILNAAHELEELNVNPRGQPPIPLKTVARLQRREGPSEIRRIGNLRGAEVQATLSGFALGRVHEELEIMLAGMDFPEGISAQLGGQKEEKEKSLNSLTMALLLAVFLVYIVMASQFENLVQPLVILLSLPLALVGVILVMDFGGIAVSVIALLGGIVLAGIVVNNAIILLDQINQLRAQGTAKLEAVVQGARLRLRPVLMTTLTTVLGLLPLTGWLSHIGLPQSWEQSPAGALVWFWNLICASGTEGLELRAPMAIVVITGLLVSTLLTLVVIPLAYTLSDRRP